MNEIAKSWYVECRKHAVETESLESFQRCVGRVTELEEESGGDTTTVKYFRPMCQSEPTVIEFQAGRFYGAIALHGQNWSVNT